MKKTDKLTKEQLERNIKKLEGKLPTKPDVFTNDFPISIEEAFYKYLRKSTISNIRTAAWYYDLHDWPMPFYIDPKNIRLGMLHKVVLAKLGIMGKGINGKDFKYYDMFGSLIMTKFPPYKIKKSLIAWIFYKTHKIKEIKYYDWFLVPILCHSFQITNLDDIVVDLFDVNFQYVKSKVLGNRLLETKIGILKEIFTTYKNRNYAACISTLYPLLDYLTRRYFNTSEFDKSITYVKSIFEKAGYTLNDIDNLKPAAFTYKNIDLYIKGKVSKEEWEELSKQHKSKLGLAGIALSSFLHFSKKYYSFYKSDNGENILNRHAIIHGASNNYYKKVNAVKLFTFLYLMLELEPVLKILFEKDS